MYTNPHFAYIVEVSTFPPPLLKVAPSHPSPLSPRYQDYPSPPPRSLPSRPSPTSTRTCCPASPVSRVSPMCQVLEIVSPPSMSPPMSVDIKILLLLPLEVSWNPCKYIVLLVWSFLFFRNIKCNV